MLFSKLRRSASPSRKHVAEVGWVLQTDHASFIWPDPRPAGRSTATPEHAKSVLYCPAVIDHEARLFEVLCPFDMRLAVRITEKEEPMLLNVDGEQSSVTPRAFSKLAFLSVRKQWRHPNRPLLQILTPYTFLSDEPIYMTQLPPILHYQERPLPGVFIGGRIPIHIWPRPLTWAFEWYDTGKELVFKRGEPWFYCRFETSDPSRHVRVLEAEMTPLLKEYLAGINGVVSYVNGSFSLFGTAQRRRPERLLKPVQRGRSLNSAVSTED
jgi:hypothetical protein